MNSVLFTIGLAILLTIGAVVSYKGLDLRKWSNWVYGVIAFLIFTAMGFALTGNLTESLMGGGLMFILTLLTGVATRRHKQRYDAGMARSLLQKYGKEDDSSLFATIVRKLLGKYR